MPDPTAFTLIPSSTVLKPSGEQVFVAVVSAPSAGTPAVISSTSLTWNLSPSIGTIDSTGKYTAPAELHEDTAVKLTAIDPVSGNRAEAAISIMSPAWRGIGAACLGIYILLIFSTVFGLMALWPRDVLIPQTANAANNQAKGTGTPSRSDTGATITSGDHASTPKGSSQSTPPSPVKSRNMQIVSPKTTSAVQPDAGTSVVDAAHAPAQNTSSVSIQGQNESKVDDSTVLTVFSQQISRELDLLLLVLLAGMLGAFLHLAQSYADFSGNRKLKESWLWWYILQPFSGAALALVFYATLRGGLVSIVPASNTSSSNLNVAGVVALCALVGLFSKAATSKLGEVFDTLFQTDTSRKTKDKLDNSLQPSQKQSAAPASGAAATNL